MGTLPSYLVCCDDIGSVFNDIVDIVSMAEAFRRAASNAASEYTAAGNHLTERYRGSVDANFVGDARYSSSLNVLAADRAYQQVQTLADMNSEVRLANRRYGHAKAVEFFASAAAKHAGAMSDIAVIAAAINNPALIVDADNAIATLKKKHDAYVHARNVVGAVDGGGTTCAARRR